MLPVALLRRGLSRPLLLTAIIAAGVAVAAAVALYPTRQVTSPAPAAASAPSVASAASAPPQAALHCRVPSPAIVVGGNYAQLAQASLAKNYPNREPDQAFEEIQRAHRHYYYAGFLAEHPSTPHRKALDCLLREFAMFEATEQYVISYEALKDKYGFNGKMEMYPWKDEMVASVRMASGERAITGDPMVGNLQFISGTITLRPAGLEFSPGTRFIYAIAASGVTAAPASAPR